MVLYGSSGGLHDFNELNKVHVNKSSIKFFLAYMSRKKLKSNKNNYDMNF
jgi:hypothetical protein